MMTSLKPNPLILERPVNSKVYNYLIDNKINVITARIVARRLNDYSYALQFCDLNLKSLTSPFLMKDMDKAVERIIKAIKNREIIGIETDYDCDGQTSHAILIEGLTKILGHSKKLIRSYVSHRINEGYGLSENLVQRILNDKIKPSLIITADNGSADELRIAKLKCKGIDTIVTDHHIIPEEGVPKSALAVLNPTQQGCSYKDTYIAGCMVAWLLITAICRHPYSKKNNINNKLNLVDLLDLVAVGTVADCVSMADSLNNRIVVYYGIKKIMQMKRLCWKILLNSGTVDSEILAFRIAPLLNSSGRISSATKSVDFLLSQNVDEIKSSIAVLEQYNKERKIIQKEITSFAMLEGLKQYKKECKSICIKLKKGHLGVHGIVASKVKEAFGLPTIIFSNKSKEKEILSGSGRSIDRLNIKNILDKINKVSSIIICYGGHSGAAGLTILKKNFDNFSELFNHFCRLKISMDKIKIGPKIFTDGLLEESDITMTLLDKINFLGPYGREFEKPIFFSYVSITNIKSFGKNSEHLEYSVLFSTITMRAIWFFGLDYQVSSKIKINTKVKIVYSLERDQFKRSNGLLINIQAVEIEDQK